MNSQEHFRGTVRPAAGTFDRIAARYDLANRILSGGADQGWRRQLVGQIPRDRALRILDLATGTGDVALILARRDPAPAQIIGCDVAEQMMAIGARKARAAGLHDRVRFLAGDALALPLGNDCVDCITIAFGLRNLTDRRRGFTEMYRALRPGGMVLVLEFSLPTGRLWRWLYLLYLRHVLPVLGGLLSGDLAAYRYLSASIQAFPPPSEVRKLMEECGFSVRIRQLTLGVVSLYVATKTPARDVSEPKEPS